MSENCSSYVSISVKSPIPTQMPKPKTLESPFYFLSLSYMSKPLALPLEPSGTFLFLPRYCYTSVQSTVI